MPGDFAARVAVGVPAAAVAVVLIVLGGPWFAATALFLGIAAMGELWGMYERVRPVKLAGFIAVMAFVAGAYFGGEHQVLLIAVAFFPLMFGLALTQPGGPTVTARLSLTTLGVFWIGLAVAHAVLLRELPHGRDIVIDVLVGTFIGDSGAYLGGRAFGRHRLAPRVSPNKTWEGLAIGFVTCIVAVQIAALYQDWLDFEHALYLGIAVGLAAPVGDLFESQVKRDAGTKDAGRLFGVHGGALDRMDAAFFALVAGYYVWGAML
ncbi:MAG: phosphatidate cytidylyltransferase [Solirubrobacteraceae bacterium]